MNSMPIRLRLTLWYFAMFASAAVILCLASFWMLQRALEETEYHGLQERADDVRVLLSQEDPGRSLEQLSDDLAAIYNLKDDGKYLQIRDDRGDWIFRSKRMTAANPDLPAPRDLPRGGKIIEFRQGIHTVRTLAYPIEANGKHFSVQTGIALDKSIVLLSSFRTSLLLLMPIVILLAGAGGHAMSRKALLPVTALAAEARRINDRNLDIRLPVSRAQDEISDLSRTLNQMLERIDKAFASVRSFTGNASHELRTPIALLRTELEVALYRPRAAEEYRETLIRMQEETVRMTSLVENLLSLARADGGAETLPLAPVNIHSLVRSIAETWNGAMRQAMLEFNMAMPCDDLFVLGDETGVLRLLSILLENACKYTPPGGSVELCAAVDGKRLAFHVKDTGVGIASEHLSRVFDRFYRAPSDKTAEGSGLGLALAKWIAERHGTELTIESELGRGSCFSFKLELADAADLTTNTRQRALQSPKVG